MLWFVFMESPTPPLTGMVVMGCLLPVDIEACAVLPLRSLGAYTARRHPGSLDAALGGPHHYDVNPTLEISACPGVDFPSLGGEADRQAF